MPRRLLEPVTASAGVFDSTGDDANWAMPVPVVRHDPATDTGPVDCAMTNAGDDKKWKARFAWTEELRRLNQDIFGNNSFRPNQQQAINATLAGKDVFLLMPTGGGEIAFRPCISLRHNVTCVQAYPPPFFTFQPDSRHGQLATNALQCGIGETCFLILVTYA